jgi:pimeloyl-ACP methyl ester carboxylesterase
VLSAATFERMGREHPDCRQATIPGVGHVPQLDEPLAIEALDEFFARC